MEQVELGRTGLLASVAALGCGGPSRLGQTYGKSAKHSVQIVQAALDAGINLIDTAAIYGTEAIVGTALAGRREGIILSTKVPIIRPRSAATGDTVIDASELRSSVERSLRELRTDRLDILFLHAVPARHYADARERLVPELDSLRRAGKIRFTGVSERFAADTDHTMLQVALKDDCWDMVMVGFNLLNPSARYTVLPTTLDKGIGTLCMFAVRRVISQPGELRRLVGALIKDGAIDADAIDADEPLGFTIQSGGAESIVEAAYRFCRHESGMDVVLTGTGNLSHLSDNVRAIQDAPLDPAALARLHDLFGHLDTVSGN